MIDLQGLLTYISGKNFYIDEQEFENGSFCFYDESGDKVIQYLNIQNMFYVNSPAFAHKRPKRHLSELTPFAKDFEFNFSLMGL